MTLTLSSCVTRKQIDAVMFTHEQVPAAICESNPELKKIGIFRIFDCTEEMVRQGICRAGQQRVREKISYCKQGIESFFGIKQDDYERIIREAGIKE